MISVGGWSVSVQKDSINTRSVSVIGNSDVSLLSPVGSPGVSNEPIVLAVFSSISNCGDGMIELSLGHNLVVRVDSSIIELPLQARGIDRDASWLGSNSSLQLGRALLWDAGKVGDRDDLFVLLDMTFFSLANIWVSLLELKGVLFSVLESPRLQTTIAALGLSIAVNQLLLRELVKLSSLEEMSGLNGSNGGESPA